MRNSTDARESLILHVCEGQGAVETGPEFIQRRHTVGCINGECGRDRSLMSVRKYFEIVAVKNGTVTALMAKAAYIGCIGCERKLFRKVNSKVESGYTFLYSRIYVRCSCVFRTIGTCIVSRGCFGSGKETGIEAREDLRDASSCFIYLWEPRVRIQALLQQRIRFRNQEKVAVLGKFTRPE